MKAHRSLWVLVAAIAAIGGHALPADAQTAVKIGVINSYSGFLAQAGDEMDKGVALYVKTHEKKTCRRASRSISSSATTPRRPKSPSASRKS